MPKEKMEPSKAMSVVDGEKKNQVKAIGSGKKEKVQGNGGKKEEKIMLTPRIIIKSQSYMWTIRCHLGSGGFGDVYKVTDNPKIGLEYAMKTEMTGAVAKRLAIERTILKEIDTFLRTSQRERHFCELIDSGQSPEYAWFVMTLIGPSLDMVRRMMKKQYTKQCVLNIALQVLDALETMHEVGFIHRDIKPGNVCVGNPPTQETVLFVVDFGISRRIYKGPNNRTLRKPRDRVPFYGTRKFCTRACHEEIDQGRKDDIETLCYTVFDLFHNERGLPWNSNLKEPKVIIEMKKALFENPEKELDECIPSGFCKIIKYVDTLKFEDEVNYRRIARYIKECREVKTASSVESFDDTMDWSGKLEKMINQKKKDEEKKKKKKENKGEETMLDEKGQKRQRNQKSGRKDKDKEDSEGEGPPGTIYDGQLGTQITTRAPAPRPVRTSTKKKGKKRN